MFKSKLEVKWIAKISWSKLGLSAFIYSVVTIVIRQIEAVVFTMKYYQLPEYSGVWNKLMMPNGGPPSSAFFITSTIMTIVSGIGLGLVYYYLREMLPKRSWQRIFFFADLLIGVQFIFFTLPVYLMFNVPPGLLISWFISSFIILVFTSFTFVKVLR